jgi:hypothetical protein
MIEQVKIQLQDGGLWRDMIYLDNNSQRILLEMKSLKSRYPDKRVRTVDSNERLIDMIG